MAAGTVEQANQAIVLRNAVMEVTVRPDLGGRIDQLHDRRTGQNWLWHPADYDAAQTRSLPIGESFDANWTGGWDEIFPNDMAAQFKGRNLVDHGELWSQSWTVDEQLPLSISLTYACKTVPVRVEKVIELNETTAEFRIAYRFQNLSDETVPFLFKQHAAIAIQPGDEIILPDCLIEPVVLDFSTMIGKPGQTRFPQAFAADGTAIDLRQTQPRSSGLREFYYSSNLAEGLCGIKRSGSALTMRFKRDDFPYVWVFQSYGGWNDHYVLILEPCTTIPYDLQIADRDGTAAYLEPQQVQYRTLVVRLDQV
jgi:galactose mutarotase-like enzyme